MDNKFKQIITKTAFCGSHLGSRVNKQKDNPFEFSVRCNRGWTLYFHPELLNKNEKKECEIIIEGGDNK